MRSHWWPERQHWPGATACAASPPTSSPTWPWRWRLTSRSCSGPRRAWPRSGRTPHGALCRALGRAGMHWCSWPLRRSVAALPSLTHTAVLPRMLLSLTRPQGGQCTSIRLPEVAAAGGVPYPPPAPAPAGTCPAWPAAASTCSTWSRRSARRMSCACSSARRPRRRRCAPLRCWGAEGPRQRRRAKPLHLDPRAPLAP